MVGVHKPHPDIFHHAVSNGKTNITDSVMVGDSIEADIRGAHGVGMDSVYFNPGQREVPEDVRVSITALAELKAMF